MREVKNSEPTRWESHGCNPVFLQPRYVQKGTDDASIHVCCNL